MGHELCQSQPRLQVHSEALDLPLASPKHIPQDSGASPQGGLQLGAALAAACEAWEPCGAWRGSSSQREGL